MEARSLQASSRHATFSKDDHILIGELEHHLWTRAGKSKVNESYGVEEQTAPCIQHVHHAFSGTRTDQANRPPVDTAVSRFTSVKQTRPPTPRITNSSRSKENFMWKPTVLLAAALAVPAQALHFFIDGAVQKCFFEELPKDTLVVGMTAL